MQSILMSREEFESFVASKAADWWGPDYRRCVVRAIFKFAGPVGEVSVELVCNALLRAGGKVYYGRADCEAPGYNLVEVNAVQVSGKGARSFYEGTFETVYRRVEREILDWINGEKKNENEIG